MNEHRARLLATLPVTERRTSIAGISTPVVEGGTGAPIVLLHGPGGSAVHWMRVIPDLAVTNRVVAPDLPGQGASEVEGVPLDATRVADWLGGLIDETCSSPPVLVGYALGGAIAARFACDHGGRLDRLVLVDSLGLVDFAPGPEFGAALHGFLAEPDEDTHERLWSQCAYDLHAVRARMGARWDAFEAYNVECARTPSVQAALGRLMELFGMPGIPDGDLARIEVPTDLIWGRHDRATPLAGAEAASERHGWALHVIEDCADDPPIEQPLNFLRELRAAIAAEPAEALS